MDTISTGNVVGLAMDLTERGIADYGLRFGEAEAYVRAPALIARREGIGADLALGSRDLAAKHGHPELAMQVKNLELPGYDPRGSFGMSVAYATADRGAENVAAGQNVRDRLFLDGSRGRVTRGRNCGEDLIGKAKMGKRH